MVYIHTVGGGWGTCTVVLKSVFEGIINGPTTLQRGGVG